MKCPEDRHELIVRTRDGQAGHGCDACDGVWLPGVFVESVAAERKLEISELSGALTKFAVAPRDLACPTGCGRLSCARVHDVELDWCVACRGLWFNRGELSEFLSHHPRRAAGAPLTTEDITRVVGRELLWMLA